MGRAYGNKERRRSPRFDMDWPLEYRVQDAPDAHGAIVVDGSEIGLRIHSLRNMPLGTKLNIVVLFRKEFQLTHFEVLAEVIWKTLCLKETGVDINMDWNLFRSRKKTFGDYKNFSCLQFDKEENHK